LQKLAEGGYVCSTIGSINFRSIWEVRSKKQVLPKIPSFYVDLTKDGQNFTYSKIMLWVALDRALRLADKRNLPCPNRLEWLKVRDTIYEEIMERGYNEEKQVPSTEIHV
jgi:GH15 family glucan-1,4-alpha-glucosidase